MTLDTISMTWLSGLYAGFTTREKLVNHAYNLFSSRGVKISHNKQQLTGEAMKKRLYELETEWRNNVLPIWQETGVIPTSKNLKKRKK